MPLVVGGIIPPADALALKQMGVAGGLHAERLQDHRHHGRRGEAGGEGERVTPLDVERATIAAWPAGETEQRDGWFFLAASGVTGRVNAVWPLTWQGGDVEAAIGDAERWYAARGMPPRFKLTGDAYAPADLPDRLARRGYAPTMHTLVMTRTLSRACVGEIGRSKPADDTAVRAGATRFNSKRR